MRTRVSTSDACATTKPLLRVFSPLNLAGFGGFHNQNLHFYAFRKVNFICNLSCITDDFDVLKDGLLLPEIAAVKQLMIVVKNATQPNFHVLERLLWQLYDRPE
jgi:hypothetical protein